VLGWREEGRLRTEVLHRFANRPVQTVDGLHWDILSLWAEMQEGLALAERWGAGRLVSVGVDTWGSDFALLDAQGTLLANPWHYRDRRTEGMQELVERTVPRAELYAQTGNQSMRQNTLLQVMAMAQAGSPILKSAATLLMIPDLFHYWLSGVRGVEFSSATTTQFYNPRAGRWATDLLEKLGLPAHLLPPIVAPGSRLGTLAPWVQEICGCGPLDVVAPLTHDTGSAVAASPVLDEGFAFISSGTWSLVGTEVSAPVIEPQGIALNITNEGGWDGTFRYLKNVLGLWLVQECRRTFERQGRAYTYEELTGLAGLAPGLRSILDPDDPLFFAPGDMPARVAEYCRGSGQHVPQDVGALIRCILESLALKYRWVIESIEGILGRRLSPVVVLGGGARNGLLNQFTADALQRPVIAGPVEATALGNLAVQMISRGELASLGEARALIRASVPPVVYEPGEGAAWDEAYARLLRLMGGG
jgi:rhamnulokinase